MNAGFIQDQQDAFRFWSECYPLPALDTIPSDYVPVPLAVIESLWFKHAMIELKEDE